MSYITKGYLATQLKNLSNRISEVFAKKTDVDSALNGKSDTGHTHTKSDVGLGNVPNVDTNDQTPTYTEATGNHELSSGEKLSVAFGKIARAIRVFYIHLRDQSNPHKVTKLQVGLGYVDNTADVNKSVKYAVSATKSKFLDGFTVQTNSSWGVQSGEFVHGEETSDGCAFRFNKNCPSSGKLSMIIDGNFYQNEGNYMCLDTNNYSSYALPLSGGTVTGSLKVNGGLNIGDKVTFWSDNEGGNIRWYSPAGVTWEFDCFDENFRLFNYKSFKNFKITRDEGDVYLPNNLYLGASTPKINLNGMYFYRDGVSNYSTHIYGNKSSYPHLWLRQFTNVFQFFPNTTYASGTKEVHIGHSSYRFGAGYFTNLYNSSGVITTSDRNKKHDIEEITDEFSKAIIDGMIPSSFKFNDGSSGRTHFGIIAQDLEKLLEALGISTTDFAPLVKEYPDKEVEIENPDYDENDEKSQKYIKKLEKDYDAEPIYNVRYEEFIMILVKYCQCLKKKDLELEKRMSELEEKVNKLIAG